MYRETGRECTSLENDALHHFFSAVSPCVSTIWFLPSMWGSQALHVSCKWCMILSLLFFPLVSCVCVCVHVCAHVCMHTCVFQACKTSAVCGVLLFDPYEFYMELCNESCSSVCLVWQKLYLRHFRQTFQPNFFIPPMLVGTVTFTVWYHFRWLWPCLEVTRSAYCKTPWLHFIAHFSADQDEI